MLTPTSASSTNKNRSQAPENTDPIPLDQCPLEASEQAKTSPRMRQPPVCNEEDGMEVDVASDDERSGEENGEKSTLRNKRVRPDSMSMADHEEPKFKRARTQEEPSPKTQQTEQTFPASSSASDTKAVDSPSKELSTSMVLRPVALTARTTLTKDEAESIIIFQGPKEKPACRLIFGESQLEWPAGYALLRVPNLRPAIEVLINDCNACLLYQGDYYPSLILLTPDSDKKQLTQGLIQHQRFEAAPETDSEDDEDGENQITTALMIAADWGDVSVTRALLDQGANPNAKNRSGSTALMLASERGHLPIIRMLILHRLTDATLTDNNSFDALCYAAQNGSADACTLLMSFGGVAIQWRMDSHPLLIAAAAGHTKVCKLFIERNVEVDLENSEKKTALMLAAKNDHMECCRMLMENGADPGRINALGDSPLKVACMNGNLNLFNLLIEKGAVVNSKKYSAPPLSCAVSINHTAIILRLIELQANLEATGPDEFTALSLACYLEHEEAAMLLLKAGANPYQQVFPFATAFALAAQSGMDQALSFMLNQNPRPARKAAIGYPALMLAIQSGQYSTAHLLLQAKIPVDMPTINLTAHYPPLLNILLSTWLPNTQELLHLLLKNGAPWNHCDNSGNDALMLAALNLNINAITMLLEHGAVIGQRNIFSNNALQISINKFEVMLDNGSTPPSESEFICLSLLIEKARRQPDWISLRSTTTKTLRHRVTRELLWQQSTWQISNYKLSFEFQPEPINRESLPQFIQSLANLDTKEWDIEDIELQLQTLLVPIPAIDFLLPYFRALPAMKNKLFISLDAPRIQENLGRSLAIGMIAIMEKLLLEAHLISAPYEVMADAAIKPALIGNATDKISSIVEWGIQCESQMMTPAFEYLFDSCLQFTLQPHLTPELSLEFAPEPGMIATQLMAMCIYPALAEAIDAGWRQSWIEICNELSATSSSSRASATLEIDSTKSGSNRHAEEFSFLDFLESDNSMYASVFTTLSERQSDQLFQRFRKAMASIVDSRNILVLPDATTEVAGIYAELMHRQVYMLAQFAREGAVTKPAANKPASASM